MPSPSRPRLLLIAAPIVTLAAAGIWIARRPSGPALPGPNVVLITLDTTRADRLGCYGSRSTRTPNLDRLAEHGIRFDRAIATAAVTPVSHASIFTGLFPHSHGLRVLHGHIGYELEPEQITLAEILRENGYQTAAFISAFPASSHFGLDQGFDFFDQQFPMAETGEELPLAKEDMRRAGIQATGRAQREARATTDAALAWLGNADSNRPFFIWVHYFDPHDLQVAPPAKYLLRKGIDRLPVSDDEVRRAYDVEVEYVDDHIGRLLRKLDLNWETEPDDDRPTLVAVVSDHGEGLGDHEWWAHGILYQEQVRVPMILFGGRYRGGAQIDTVIRTVDLLPTLLEQAGIELPDDATLDGKSLTPLLPDGPNPASPPQHRLALADSINRTFYYWGNSRDRKTQKDDRLYCLIEWPWKLIYHQYDPDQSELYQLERDPRELNDLAHAHPEQRTTLERKLKSLGALTSVDYQNPALMDPAVLEKLKALGYVGGQDSTESSVPPASQPAPPTQTQPAEAR